jgi:hypothetical protein
MDFWKSYNCNEVITMSQIKRESPVQFGVSPKASVVRDNWTVALEYDDEGRGPFMVDLSHKTRWDLQDGNIGGLTPCDIAVPEALGQSTFSGNILISRMNRTQASIWHLGVQAPAMPEETGYTETTEAAVCMAIFGQSAFALAEKLTNLDLMDPAKKAPFLVQGPFCHVPCQIVVLEKTLEGGGGFILTCSRGYGDSMVHAIEEAGAEFSLRPAGETRFSNWLDELQG